MVFIAILVQNELNRINRNWYFDISVLYMILEDCKLSKCINIFYIVN